MEYNTIIEHIALTPDMESVSIRIRTSVTDAQGNVYAGKAQRRAFSSYLTDDNGNRTPNPDFFADIDVFTGQTDFMTGKFNF